MSVSKDLQRKVFKAYKKLSIQEGWPTLKLSDIPLERPRKAEHGDYATAVALRIGKELNKNPREIGELLAKSLESIAMVAKVEVAGAGFINIFLTDVYIQKQLSKIVKEGDAYLRTIEGRGEPVVIEYSSPNIAKPFGIGHLRSTIIGGALANVYELAGYKVIHENHLGDWGTQFGRVLDAYERWGDESALDKNPVEYLYELYVRHNEESEKDEALIESGRAWFKKLEEGDKEARALWSKFREASLGEFGKIYDELGVSKKLKNEHGEAFYEKQLSKILKSLQAKKIVKRSEGALIVELDEENLPPLMLEKSDGATTYALRDIAAALYRKAQYRPKKVLYEVGSEQKLHFQQLFAAMHKAGYEWVEDYAHVSHGRYRFAEGSMSSRKGNIVRFEDLLSQARMRVATIIEEKNPDLEDKAEAIESVAIGALKFNDLAQNRETDIVFDWDKVLNVEGDSGPYLQYTYARLRSILRKSEMTDKEIKRIKLSADDLQEAEARSVMSLLIRMPDVINVVLKENAPHHIAIYLLELAREANAFYHKYRVLDASEAEKRARLLLIAGVAEIIKDGLALLGIGVEEKM
ncbi:arginine--tRNA ligase [Patescibacteria group bacterium]